DRAKERVFASIDDREAEVLIVWCVGIVRAIRERQDRETRTVFAHRAYDFGARHALWVKQSHPLGPKQNSPFSVEHPWALAFFPVKIAVLDTEACLGVRAQPRAGAESRAESALSIEDPPYFPGRDIVDHHSHPRGDALRIGHGVDAEHIGSVGRDRRMAV